MKPVPIPPIPFPFPVFFLVIVPIFRLNEYLFKPVTPKTTVLVFPGSTVISYFYESLNGGIIAYPFAFVVTFSTTLRSLL